MKNAMHVKSFSSRWGALLLAAAFASPMLAQQAQPSAEPETAPNSEATAPQTVATPAQQASKSTESNAGKEGFWGHMNPFARKKWVKRQTEPLNDQLSELDEVNAKNAKDIQDTDTRARAGIRRAQSSADSANQTATAASSVAQQAGDAAKNADARITRMGGKIDGLDQYHTVTSAEIQFRSGQPVLSAEARKKLDDLAASVNGQQGYMLELEAHSPLSGAAGIQSSARLGEAVKRYLVTQHEIPVYRLHTVALGNARSGDMETKSVRKSLVKVQIMENSLASETATQPSGMAMAAGPK